MKKIAILFAAAGLISLYFGAQHEPREATYAERLSVVADGGSETIMWGEEF